MSIDNEEAWFVTPQLHSLTLILLYQIMYTFIFNTQICTTQLQIF